MYGLGGVERLDSLRAAELVKAAADSIYLRLADRRARPEAVPGAASGMVAETFLTEGLRVSRGQACRGVRAAVAVAAGSGTMYRPELLDGFLTQTGLTLEAAPP